VTRKPTLSPAVSGILEEMTLEDVRAFRPQVVVIPFGSTEPHGPHLPYGTDTFEVSALAKMAVLRANRNKGRVLLYPTLPITNNVNQRGFPFALRIGVRTLMTLIVDIVTQCREDGIRKVVLVNGHGGNTDTLKAVLREIAGMDNMPFTCMAHIHPAVSGFKTPIEHPSDHAGEDETSRVMLLRPELVRTNKLKNFPRGEVKIPALKYADFVRPWHLYLPESAGGETRKATPAKGHAVIDANARALSELLVELSRAKYDKRFPYK
jgi:creatinine amidohydrolase